MSKAERILQKAKIGGVVGTATAIGLFSKQKGLQFLANSLGNIPGLPAKFSQILELRTGIEMPRHQPLLAEDEVRGLILTRCPELYQQVDRFGEICYQASLSQVNQIFLKDGREVAVKLQIEGVKEAIEDQLELLINLLAKSPAARYGMNAEDYRAFLLDFFSNELDYRKELQSQIRFFQNWSQNACIIVPRVLPGFSTETVLTQEWELGIDAKRLAGEFGFEARKSLAESLTLFCWKNALDFGLVQTDFNLGNWSARLNDSGGAELVAYDFGATIVLEDNQRADLKNLVLAAWGRDSATVKGTLIRLGFDREIISRIDDKLTDLLQLVCEPLACASTWQPSTWDIGNRMDRLLGKEAWNFRAAGPPWFLMFMRSIQGWYDSLKVIDAGVDMSYVRKELGLEGHEVVVDSEIGAATEDEPLILADHLIVKVWKDNQLSVSLEFPARTAAEIESLMPAEVNKQLPEAGIDLKHVLRQIRVSNFAPQTLFTFENGEKRILVKLV